MTCFGRDVLAPLWGSMPTADLTHDSVSSHFEHFVKHLSLFCLNLLSEIISRTYFLDN